MHGPTLPAFEALLPYAAGLVELDEGPFMVGQLRGCDPRALRAGLRVRVEFDDVADGRLAAALEGRVTPVVVGIGQARAGRGRTISAAALAARAITMALRDAGVRLEEVDGIVRFDREAAWEYDLPGRAAACARSATTVPCPTRPAAAPALVRLAAMAVSQELAEVVVAYHARSEPRPAVPSGVLAAACSGVVDEEVPASGRGGCAFVVRAVERRGRERHAPVRILGSLQAAVPSAERHLDAWLASREAGVVQAAARRMFDEANLGPDAVDVACLYAQPAALVPLALQDLSLPRGRRPPAGESARRVAVGDRSRWCGRRARGRAPAARRGRAPGGRRPRRAGRVLPARADVGSAAGGARCVIRASRSIA